MKIIDKTAVYVQKKDLKFIYVNNLPITEEVALRLVSNPMINDSNQYEFEKFEDKETIKYFKNLDWIIEYDKIKYYTEDELIEICKKIINESNKIADKFNKMNNALKEKHLDMITRCELLEYKMHSIRDALWFKQGRITVSLPESNYKKLKKFKSFNKKTP